MASRIAALIGHADDFDLLRTCIERLRALGIDAICVTADAAVTGDDRELQALEERGETRVVYHGESQADAFHFLRRTAVETVAWARADWLLILDSDELAVCRFPELRLVPELEEADVVRIERVNAVPRRDPFVIARPHAIDLAEHAEDAWPPWIVSRIQPRNLFRGNVVKDVRIGGHAVGASADVRVRTCESALIVHHPITSFERFERKVHRIQQILDSPAQRFGEAEALHWKRWAKIARAGRLEAEYERQLLPEGRFGDLVADGTIATVDALLRERPPSPIP